MLSLRRSRSMNKRGDALGGFLGMFVATILILIILVVFGMMSSFARVFDVGDVSSRGVMIEKSFEEEMIDYSHLFDELNLRRGMVLTGEIDELGVDEIIILSTSEYGESPKSLGYTYYKFLDEKWFWSCDLAKWYDVSRTSPYGGDNGFGYDGSGFKAISPSKCRVISAVVNNELKVMNLAEGIEYIRGLDSQSSHLKYSGEVGYGYE